MRKVSASQARTRTPAMPVAVEEFDRKITELLALLAEVDTRYDKDRAALEMWDGPEGTKVLQQQQLESRHRKAREPYVLALADAYQHKMSLMLYRSVH